MEHNSEFEHDQTHDNNHYAQEPNNSTAQGTEPHYYPNDNASTYDQQYPQDQQQPTQTPPQQPQPGPTQFTSQSAQINFTYQNNPQPGGQPYRPSPARYHQPNPVYVNPLQRPQPQPTNLPPHSPVHNMGGPQYGPLPPPQKAASDYHQTPASPMKFGSEKSGPGGYGGPMPGYGNGPGPNHVPGVPVQQPPQYGRVPHQMVGVEPWKSGLFDCMNDPSNALITALCPCITFGQVAEIIDNGHTTCSSSGLIYGLAYMLAVPCIVSWSYRTKLRNKYGLTETPAPDLVSHLLCEWCALCQLYRELNDRGLNPAIGWEGNVARMNLEAFQRNQVQMTPPAHERMMP